MYIVLAIIIGALFGFVLYLSGASTPKKLVAMLRLQNLTIMKTIVFAIGFASVLLSITAMLGWFNPSHLSIKVTNLGVIIGGLIFGFGFGGVGTCPGTCVAATGSGGLKKGIFAVIGGLFGAYTFSVTYGFFRDIGLFDTMDLGKLTLFKISDKFESVFSLGYPGLLIVGLLFIGGAFTLPLKSHK